MFSSRLGPGRRNESFLILIINAHSTCAGWTRHLVPPTLSSVGITLSKPLYLCCLLPPLKGAATAELSLALPGITHSQNTQSLGCQLCPILAVLMISTRRVDVVIKIICKEFRSSLLSNGHISVCQYVFRCIPGPMEESLL